MQKRIPHVSRYPKASGLRRTPPRSKRLTSRKGTFAFLPRAQSCSNATYSRRAMGVSTLAATAPPATKAHVSQGKPFVRVYPASRGRIDTNTVCNPRGHGSRRNLVLCHVWSLRLMSHGHGPGLCGNVFQNQETSKTMYNT